MADQDDAVAVYVSEVGQSKPLAKDDEEMLFHQLSGTGDWDEARENIARRLIEGHLLQVVRIAQKHSDLETPMLDLIEEGNNGLLDAVKTFAQRPIGDFADYAATCIEKAIQKALG